MNTAKKTLIELLEKNGSNIYEFEDALSRINTAEGIQKFAALAKSALDPIGAVTGAAKGVGSILGFGGDALLALGMGSAAIGSGIGAGGLMASRHLDAQDDRMSQKQHEIDRMNTLIQRLKTDYGMKY